MTLDQNQDASYNQQCLTVNGICCCSTIWQSWKKAEQMPMFVKERCTLVRRVVLKQLSVKMKMVTSSKVILNSCHIRGKSIQIFPLLEKEDSIITWASQQHTNVKSQMLVIKNTCITVVLKHAESCHTAEILNLQAVYIGT